MDKINSYSKLLELYETFKGQLALRHDELCDSASKKKDIMVCGGTGCQASESHILAAHLRDILKEKGLDKDIKVVETGCFGFCEKGPIVKIYPDNVFYVEVKPSDARPLVEEHIIGGTIIERLLYIEPTLKQRVQTHDKMSFYGKQMRISLRNCGHINPECIEECIAAKGYQALGQCLSTMKPADVIQLIKESGLRGRGGAGFPTGLKWEIASKYHTQDKFMICNADEGDPGAFMDRSIMEGDPNCVIEAMSIGAYAIGANRGFVYIRAEYPLAVGRLEKAIKDARNAGLLGKNIMGTDFSFDIEIKLGAGAFVCGEETALIHSMEGYRGEPTTKPPFPAESGLWQQSSNVNNVETFAAIPQIIRNGAAWYKSIGTADSAGTKVFALAGQVDNVGLVEVPMGTTLREIIFDIGGGIRGGKAFKAVQTGGPSGGCISTENLDIPIDFANLGKVGSMMGSGGMIVLSEKDCMVNIAKFYLEFTVEESCGKCTPCRVGTKRMLELLEKICDGNGTMEMLEELETLGNVIKDTALCGLGQTAPNPVLSTLKFFRNEYLAHVQDKRCPAGSCSKLYKLLINEKCVGCGMCKRVCPVEAIDGEKKQMHVINQTKCIKCNACIDSCKFKAIIKA